MPDITEVFRVSVPVSTAGCSIRISVYLLKQPQCSPAELWFTH